MIPSTRLSAVLICLILTGLSINAQITPKAKTASNSRTSSAQQATAQTQRVTAIQMITSLADESAHFKDETLRAQVQARAADALWDEDPWLSRELFLQAWKIAENVDKENERVASEARVNAMNSREGGLLVLTPPISVRTEVLKLAARRDSELAESFLAKFNEAKDDENATASSRENSSFFDPTEPGIAIVKRLEIATTLIDRGVERATAFARPALKEVTTPAIIFLCTLRQKDRRVADDLYYQMLLRSNDDLRSDATTVSLLSTYIFTPNLIVTATRRGRIMNPFADSGQNTDYSPTLRPAFFRIAAGILLRPSPLPNQDQTAAGRAGTFFTIARLLPLFEQYSPASVPALKTQMLMLGADLSDAAKNEDDIMLRAGLTPAKQEEKEPPESVEQQLAKVTTAAERDLLYVKAIQSGAARGDMVIRQYASKIEDPLLKEQARTFSDLAIVRTAINKRDIDGVLRIVREGNLTPLHRVWALATAASILAKSDLPRALDFLNDASSEARRIKVGESARVYALACVAQQSLELDSNKIQDLAPDIVKSLNAVTDFNVEGGKLYAQVRSRDVVAMINVREQSFNVVSFFEKLSKQDLQMALTLANDVKPDAPRAATTLAIAGLILKGQTSAVSLRE